MSTISQEINWDALKQKIEYSQHVLSEEFSPSQEMTSLLLRERARDLSKRPEDTQEVVTKDWLMFVISGEVYGVAPEYVVSVVAARQITPIPCTPAHILGVVSFRGRMVSVVDLRVLFNLPLKGLTDRNSLLILAKENMEFGLLTDQVIGVRPIKDKDISPPPEYLAGIHADYLYGITSSQHAVLDAAKMLSDPHLIVNEPT